MKMNKKPKFKVGDKVQIVKYGSLYYASTSEKVCLAQGLPVIFERDGFKAFDMRPELVGKVGTVDGHIETQGMHKYSVAGIPGKHAWYSEGQLEKVPVFQRICKWWRELWK